MSFDKMIPSQIQEYKVFNVNSTDELIKEASDVDFPEGFIYDSDYLYLWVRIVSAGEYWGPNKNGDYFPQDQLEEFWETFNEAHPFKNHKNKNVEDAIGKIITVRWNPRMKGVELLKGIDKKRAPEIARGYLKGYLTDVSMGCKVPYTICSICGNKARKQSEFCDHVKLHRLQMLGNGERVFEINYSPKFHDSSTVLNGAERVAKAFMIIDSPPDGVEVAFRKMASTNGKSTRFVRLTEHEMDKVASVQSDMHPLLQEETFEKEAAKSPAMMRKIAEIEKELTGKLLNVTSAPKTNAPQMKQMLQVIKFLTEKRMDDISLNNMAETIKDVAKANGVPVSRAFATLIGMAELMGIELFPTELHTILRGLTDNGLHDDFALSPSSELPVYPSEFAKGLGDAVVSMQSVPDFADSSSLMNLYDDAAHYDDAFSDDPLSFLSNISDGDDLGSVPPVRVIKVIHQTLSPIAAVRSANPDVLLPKLSVVLAGHRPVVGGPAVRQDLNMLMNPVTPGDALGKLAYSIYQNLRPLLKGSRLVKHAEAATGGLEKTASGLGYGKLALMAVPSAYATSAFQKDRRKNGRYLTDNENFLADHPGIVAGGAIVAGKPLTKAVHEVANMGKKVSTPAVDLFKKNFIKMADYRSFEGLVKVADTMPSGDFNVFSGHEVSKRYMEATGANGEQASAVKMATLLSAAGMDKEAYEIMDFYNIPVHEKGHFLKVAANYLDEEMDKAAGDFTNNMILSAIGDTSPLAPTLPGRAVDAFVFKQLGKLVQPKQLKNGEPVQPTNGGNVQ